LRGRRVVGIFVGIFTWGGIMPLRFLLALQRPGWANGRAEPPTVAIDQSSDLGVEFRLPRA
jgi:hypothetical protein